jgi:hypothetical protein
VPRYLNISKELQIVRGAGCGFLPGPPINELESVEIQVSTWLENNEFHPDAGEARRWLAAAGAIIERARKDRQLKTEVAAFKNRLVESLKADGDLRAKWHVDHYRHPEVEKYETHLRQKMGLA